MADERDQREALREWARKMYLREQMRTDALSAVRRRRVHMCGGACFGSLSWRPARLSHAR